MSRFVFSDIHLVSKLVLGNSLRQQYFATTPHGMMLTVSRKMAKILTVSRKSHYSIETLLK